MTNLYDAPDSNSTTHSLDLKNLSVQQNGWSTGWQWFVSGAALIKQSPGLIVGSCLVMICISIITSIVTASTPVIGHYIGYTVGLLAKVGFIIICTKLLDGENTGIGDLFTPFQIRIAESALSSLLSGFALFVITVICTIAISVVIYLGTSGLIERTEMQHSSSVSEIFDIFGFGSLAIMAILITAAVMILQLFYMAAIFACFLTHTYDTKPTEGLGLAARACSDNIRAMITLWFLITLAAIPWITILIASINFSGEFGPVISHPALITLALPLGLLNGVIYCCSLATAYKGIFSPQKALSHVTA